MRIDSCRKCGGKRESIKQEELVCEICKSPTKFICTDCEDETEIQFHVHNDKEKIIVKPLLFQ